MKTLKGESKQKLSRPHLVNVSDELFLKGYDHRFFWGDVRRSVWRRTAVEGENMILVFIKILLGVPTREEKVVLA